MIQLAWRDVWSPTFPHQPGQIALRLPLLRTNRLHVNVGCDLQAGVTQELLHDFLVLAICVQESSKCVAKRVIRDLLRHAGTLECCLAVISGYIPEFVDSWAANPAVEKIWMSIFTPQRVSVSIVFPVRCPL